MTAEAQTISALATAVGGAVAIVRLSGPEAMTVADRIWKGPTPLERVPPRTAVLGRVLAGDNVVDHGVLLIRFPGPNSYTGEDVVELHCHGGALGARLVLLETLRAGARHAEAGEFTRRAFLNGRMDLTQAEAVADLICAHSEAALHVAGRQLQGLLGRRIDTACDAALSVLAEAEARLDFPEENLDWVPREDLLETLRDIGDTVAALLGSRQEGDVLRNGVRLVLAGPPNVGKSSLLNAILGRDRAIVTHIPGTTRDTLEELAHIRGIPVHLTDTAGIRESADPIEKTGIERAHASAEEAEIVLWVTDASRPLSEQPAPQSWGSKPTLIVRNKNDLATAAEPSEGTPTCALTGEGLEALFDRIEESVWQHPHSREPAVAVSARHAHWLEQAGRDLDAARTFLLEEQWELVAEALKAAADALGRVTGKTIIPDILDTIFSRFCIGK